MRTGGLFNYLAGLECCVLPIPQVRVHCSGRDSTDTVLLDTLELMKVPHNAGKLTPIGHCMLLIHCVHNCLCMMRRRKGCVCVERGAWCVRGVWCVCTHVITVWVRRFL